MRTQPKHSKLLTKSTRFPLVFLSVDNTFFVYVVSTPFSLYFLTEVLLRFIIYDFVQFAVLFSIHSINCFWFNPIRFLSLIYFVDIFNSFVLVFVCFVLITIWWTLVTNCVFDYIYYACMFTVIMVIDKWDWPFCLSLVPFERFAPKCVFPFWFYTGSIRGYEISAPKFVLDWLRISLFLGYLLFLVQLAVLMYILGFQFNFVCIFNYNVLFLFMQ